MISRFSGFANLTALIGLSIFAPSTQAVLLGQYTFENNSLAASDVVSSNLNFSSFSADTGLSGSGFAQGNPVTGSAIIRTNWSASSNYSPSNNQNFFFSVTPSSTSINVTDLTFDARRSATGPANLYVSSSIDNYSSAVSLTSSTNFTTLTANLANLSSITTPITFKVSGTGSTNSGGTLRLDNVQLNGTVGQFVPPSNPVISIYQSSNYLGQTVKTQGVVTANFLASDGGNNLGLGGFFIQEANSTNNPQSSGLSNGIFVSASSSLSSSIKVGDLIDVVGQVSQTTSSGVTKNQISLSTFTDKGVSNTPITPTTITLPVANTSTLQSYQGMLVNLPQTLTVTNNFGLGRYGEVGLSSGGLLYTPTQVALPGVAADGVRLSNSLNYIALDDANRKQNVDPIIYPNNAQGGLTASNTLRVGNTTSGLTGILDSTSNVSGPGTANYLIQPTVTPTFDTTTTNPRPQTVPNVGGNIKVASANVQNYFTTLGSRGAQSELEFQRQQAKVVSNLFGLNADIFGLSELENNGYSSNPNSSIVSLVNALNTRAGIPGLYTYIDPGLTQIGTDAIAVGIIYKPAKVTPVGNAAILDTGIFAPGLNRPSLAQTFVSLSGGQQFTIDINHFKSKGSGGASGSCSAADNLDIGQGNSNCTRTTQAKELGTWLATNPTNSNNSNILILGDLNSYAKEDPIVALQSSQFGSFTDLEQRFSGGKVPTSYQFSGQLGTLDYGLASPSLNPFITGASTWHINADEPAVLDYGTSFKSSSQIDSLFAPNQFASSDHDPVLIGLTFTTQAVPEPSTILGAFFGLGLLSFAKNKSRKK